MRQAKSGRVEEGKTSIGTAVKHGEKKEWTVKPLSRSRGGEMRKNLSKPTVPISPLIINALVKQLLKHFSNNEERKSNIGKPTRGSRTVSKTKFEGRIKRIWTT